MKCKTLHKKLIFFLENDLPEEEEELIKNHLDECADCRAFAEYMKQMLNVMQKEKSPGVNPFFYTQLKAKMEREESVPEQFVPGKVWKRVLQPAFFSLLLITGIYAGIKIGAEAHSKSSYNAYSEYEIFSYLDEMQSEPIETFLME